VLASGGDVSDMNEIQLAMNEIQLADQIFCVKYHYVVCSNE
jgi:hypothetical protein